MVLKQPLFQQNDTTDQSADVTRLMFRGLVNERPGVIQGTALEVKQRAAGANNSVDISAGDIIIPGTSVASQGYYFVTNDATVNLPMSTAAHGSLPRIDAVIVRVRDAFYTGADNDAQFLYVAGTAASSPVRPDLAALGYINFWRLCDISVPAGDNTITSGDITDTRTSTSVIPTQGYASAVGGCIVCTSGTRPSSPRGGQLIWETDTKRLLINEGGYAAVNWQPISHNNSWTTFTPTWGGVTLGSGALNVGSYMKLGRIAFAKAHFILGTGGNVTALITWTPPAAIAMRVQSDRNEAVAMVWGGGNNRWGGVGIRAATESTVSRFASSGTNIGWGTLEPFDWTATHQLELLAIYETAS